jgi:hypothetical protein
MLHKQFECHNIYRRVKNISEKGKYVSWNLEDEALYKSLDDDISESVKDAEQMRNIHKAHVTPWKNSLGQATHSILYWDARITHRDIRANDDLTQH